MVEWDALGPSKRLGGKKNAWDTQGPSERFSKTNGVMSYMDDWYVLLLSIVFECIMKKVCLKIQCVVCMLVWFSLDCLLVCAYQYECFL